jgi:multicomponent Na+:H+ antiporter subunit D
MAGFCLTGDLFNLFVFFELMAVSAFGLAAYHTRSRGALRGALNFAITNSIGAFLVLIGVALLYGRTGALNLAQIGQQLSATGHVDRLTIVALSLLMVGFLIKAAVVPFHFWLIDTASSAPLPVVIVLAGALDTLGVYAVARIYWTVFATPLSAQQHVVQTLLISIGAISAVVGAAVALVLHEPDRTLPFVMVSHTGILLIGVGCLTAPGLAGAGIYAVGDGTVKAALFIGVALLGLRSSIDAEDAPVSSPARHRGGLVLVTVGGLATAGLPLFATALGKAAIGDAAATAGYPWVTPVLVVAAALSAAAVLEIAWTARRVPVPSGPSAGAARGPWVSAFGAGLALLAASSAALAARRWATTAASRFVDTTGYQQRVLRGVVLSVRSVPAIGLSTPAALLELGAVLAAVVVTAAVNSDLKGRARSFGPSLIRSALRRLHDGSIGDSATWVTVGAATTAAVLAVYLH